MALVFPNVGKIAALDDVVNAGSIEIGLFTSVAGGIDRDTVLGDVVECTYAGYARQNASGWTPSAINAANKAQSDADLLTWLATGAAPANTIAGAFYVDPTGDLLCLEEFATGPITFDFAGATFGYIPRLTAKSEFSN